MFRTHVSRENGKNTRCRQRGSSFSPPSRLFSLVKTIRQLKKTLRVVNRSAFHSRVKFINNFELFVYSDKLEIYNSNEFKLNTFEEKEEKSLCSYLQ